MNMNRKHFLSHSLTLALGAGIGPMARRNDEESAVSIKIPPYLKPGDTIGITSPAGAIKPEEVAPAIGVMESWGFRTVLGSSIGKKDFTLGGTDAERLTDLQQMLDDPTIKAIMCARGGYGSLRIVDRLQWKRFMAKPKWLIGFSDITVLHSHIHNICGVASIHSKMTNSFPDDWQKAEPIQVSTIESIRDALTSKPMKYTAAASPQNHTGKATGLLVGGNLKTIESLAGTASDIHTAGKILFVEDTGEYLYSIDRMFWNLKRTSKLKSLKALIVGGFKIKPDDPGDEFGKTLQEIVLEKIDGSYPVCFDFPVGHQRANFALKCGVKHTLTVTKDDVQLTETL